jgi:hypothetical protein
LTGNIGIGILNPSSKLHVFDKGTTIIYITAQSIYPDDIIITPDPLNYRGEIVAGDRGFIDNYKYIIFKFNSNDAYSLDTQNITQYKFLITEDLMCDLLVVGGGGAGGNLYGGGGGGGEVYLTSNIVINRSTNPNYVYVGRGGIGLDTTDTSIYQNNIVGKKSEVFLDNKWYGAEGGGGGATFANTYTYSSYINGRSPGGERSRAYSSLTSYKGQLSNPDSSYDATRTTNLINPSVNTSYFRIDRNIYNDLPVGAQYDLNLMIGGPGGGVGSKFIGNSYVPGAWTGVTNNIYGVPIIYGASGNGGISLNDVIGSERQVIPADKLQTVNTWFNTNSPFKSYGTGGGGGRGTNINNVKVDTHSATSGAPNTGSGGGGNAHPINTAEKAGNGGSGVVILRYKKNGAVIMNSLIVLNVLNDTFTDFQIGNYNGEFKIISTKKLPSVVTTTNLTINSDGNIILGGSINAISFESSSDRRIKEDIQDINDNSALQMILSIEPKTYKYIDKIERGYNRVYGFIAQQIREIIPEATSIRKSYIPNIMLLADYNDCIVTLPSQPTKIIIKQNDKIKCYINNTEINVDVVEIIDELRFRIKALENFTDTKIFVYGTEIYDFHTLDKTYIFTLNICATQELHRRIEAQDVIIKAEDERIKKLEQILGV